MQECGSRWKDQPSLRGGFGFRPVLRVLKLPATIDSSLRDGRNRDGPKPADILISPQLRNDILASSRLLTPKHCLKLGRYFGNEPEYRMRLQNHYLLRRTGADKAAELASIRPLQKAG